MPRLLSLRTNQLGGQLKFRRASILFTVYRSAEFVSQRPILGASRAKAKRASTQSSPSLEALFTFREQAGCGKNFWVARIAGCGENAGCGCPGQALKKAAKQQGRGPSSPGLTVGKWLVVSVEAWLCGKVTTALTPSLAKHNNRIALLTLFNMALHSFPVVLKSKPRAFVGVLAPTFTIFVTLVNWLEILT